MTTAGLVLETRLDPLESRTLMVADDQRMAQIPAVGSYLVGVASGVHPIVQLVANPSLQSVRSIP